MSLCVLGYPGVSWGNKTDPTFMLTVDGYQSLEHIKVGQGHQITCSACSKRILWTINMQSLTVSAISAIKFINNLWCTDLPETL